MKWIRSITGTLILFFLSTGAWSQKQHFVYFQSEQNKPFYVRLNQKNYSSSAVGYLILSKMENGKYPVTVGFPGKQATQQYEIEIKDGDLGFLIKNFDGADQFGLLNLQSAQVQMSGSAQKNAADLAQKEENDRLEAERQAKEDLQKEEARKAEEQRVALQKDADEKKRQAEADDLKRKQDAEALKKKEQDELLKKNEDTRIALESAAAVKVVEEKQNEGGEKQVTSAKENQEISKQATEASGSVKEAKSVSGTTVAVAPASVSNGSSGRLSQAEIARLQEMARKVDAEGKRDSVLNSQKTTPPGQKTFLDFDISMPDQDSVKNENEKKQPQSVPATLLVPSTPVASKDTTNSGMQENAPVVAMGAEKPVVKEDAAPVKKDPVPTLRKNDCPGQIADSELELVIMLMKGEKLPDDALELARKTLKLKCATTEQIRKMALVFEKDEDRYRLLDTGYRYTIDTEHYPGLENLLRDDYFVRRFKAMLY